MGVEYPYWTAGISLERMTRDFVNGLTPLPAPPRVPVAPPVAEDEEEPEAKLEWGGGSGTQPKVPTPIEDIDADGFLNDHYQGSVFNTQTAGADGKKKKPPKKPPQDQRPGIMSADEIDRQTIKYKVYNPTDKDQYVIVEAIKSIRFRLTVDAPDESRLSGRIFKMNLKPPPPPREPAN